MVFVSRLAYFGIGLCNRDKDDWTMASLFLSNAIGCGVILAIAGWMRAKHRMR
jgi:hypothetical protein